MMLWISTKTFMFEKSRFKRTSHHWEIWVQKETPPLEDLPEKIAELYRRSLLILRTQVDWQGGIVAANDSDVIQYNRDTYSYVWPRDGALVANALDLAGYPGLAQNFYQFIAKCVEPEGYPAAQIQSGRHTGLFLAPLV